MLNHSKPVRRRAFAIPTPRTEQQNGSFQADGTHLSPCPSCCRTFLMQNHGDGQLPTFAFTCIGRANLYLARVEHFDGGPNKNGFATCPAFGASGSRTLRLYNMLCSFTLSHSRSVVRQEQPMVQFVAAGTPCLLSFS